MLSTLLEGAPDGATPGAESTFRVKTEVVATRLEVPWALAFTPRIPAATSAGPFILVTERPGRLRLIANGTLLPDPVATLPVAAVGEGGLLGLALDPGFAQNGYLYVMYTERRPNGLRNRIVRLTIQGTRAGAERVLLDDIPGGNIHDGGALRFGPDGKLYATTGETGNGSLAQNVGSLAGKVLRIDPDGSVPRDNPFAGSPVYSYGHRNPQGLAWHPGTGELYITEHGPSAGVNILSCCHDEVNVVRPGGNYGWPAVFGIARDARYLDPVVESGDQTWAPAGAEFYQGDLLAPWRGSLLFGTLRGSHLHRLMLGGANRHQPSGDERLFQGAFGRIRAVALGPEGALYFATSNRDLRAVPGSEDDRIVRVIPAP